MADEEIGIEKLRQSLASTMEFEPYAAFQRIDREGQGYLNSKKICKYLKENGYRELTKEDVMFAVRYFDQDGDMRLTFHE
jgi:Ca2+-binding EF-hand superfamily protein